jgi:hypothetical protein
VVWIHLAQDRVQWQDLGKTILNSDYGIILKKVLKEIGREVLDWIYLAQDRVQWQDLAKTILNFD